MVYFGYIIVNTQHIGAITYKSNTNNKNDSNNNFVSPITKFDVSVSKFGGLGNLAVRRMCVATNFTV